MATGNIFPKVTGDTIYAADYNGVVAIMTSVLGQNATGYGIVPRSSTVIVGGKIQASSWDNLRLDLDQCRLHQNNSTAGLVDENAGDKVSATDVSAYYNAAVTSYVNKDVINSVDVALISGVASSYAVAWKASISQVVTVSFATSTTMSNFFNAGGNIRVGASSTGATTASKDANWNSLITGLGLHYYTAANYRAGGNISIKGPVYGTGNYSANYYRAWVEASATSLKVTTLFNDASVQTQSGGVPGAPAAGSIYDENVTLGITSSVDYYKSLNNVVVPIPTGIVLTKTLSP
jgi:hypothetical protein